MFHADTLERLAEMMVPDIIKMVNANSKRPLTRQNKIAMILCYLFPKAPGLVPDGSPN